MRYAAGSWQNTAALIVPGASPAGVAPHPLGSMRRSGMRRRILNTAAVLSTLVLVAVVVLWGVSYVRILGLSNCLFKGSQLRGESGIWSTGGRVLPDTARHTDVPRIPAWHGAKFSNDPYVAQPQFVDQPSVTRWHALGFRVAQSLSPSGDGTVVEFADVAVPYWVIAALASPTPVTVFGEVLFRRRRRLAGRCERCGYDLRASAGRCPECGNPTVIARTVAT